jgi:predicted exporter
LNQESQFFLVSGSDMDDWYQNEQQLLNQLALLTRQQALVGFQGISDFWPNRYQQQESYQLMNESMYGSALINQYMTALGFSDNNIKAEIKQFAKASNNFLAIEKWLETTDEAKQQLWQGCDASHCASIVSLMGISDLSKISALQNLPGVVWVDQAEQLSSLFARYRVRVSVLLIAAYLLVLTGLGFKFGWINSLRITSVPVISAVVSLAMMGWFDQLFSLFNLFALLLVLGIGVDDAIFFFMAEQANGKNDEKRASTSLAVILSSLTTLLAFGLLAVSSTEIVHAFGFTVAVGILTALLLSPLVGHRGVITK